MARWVEEDGRCPIVVHHLRFAKRYIYTAAQANESRCPRCKQTLVSSYRCEKTGHQWYVPTKAWCRMVVSLAAVIGPWRTSLPEISSTLNVNHFLSSPHLYSYCTGKRFRPPSRRRDSSAGERIVFDNVLATFALSTDASTSGFNVGFDEICPTMKYTMFTPDTLMIYHFFAHQDSSMPRLLS